MEEKRKSHGTGRQNEGEGNKTAARQYNEAQRHNEAQRRFVETGKVEEKAQEAEKSLQGREKGELERAEAIGKRHMVAEDPEITRKP